MTSHLIKIKFMYKGQWIYLIVKDLAKLATLYPGNYPLKSMANYECDLIIFIHGWLCSHVDGISHFETDAVAQDLSQHSGFSFRIKKEYIGEFYSACDSVLGEFEYKLNNDNYLRLPYASLVLNTQLQLFDQPVSVRISNSIDFKPSKLLLNIKLTINGVEYGVYIAQNDAQELFKDLGLTQSDEVAKLENLLGEIGSQLDFCKNKEWKVIKVTLTNKINQSKSYLPFNLSFNDKNILVLLLGCEEVIRAQTALPPTFSLANNFIIPFKLIHGVLQLTIHEITNLEKGDVLFFDQSFAPKQVLLTTSVTAGAICDMAENKLTVKELY